MPHRTLLSAALGGVLLLVVSAAWGTSLSVDVAPTRGAGSDQWRAAVDAAAGRVALNAAQLTRSSRRLQGLTQPFALPMRVTLTQNGVPLSPSARSRDNQFQLEFPSDRPFPPEYQALLQSVWTSAQNRLLSLTGTPAQTGSVRVAQYDDLLPDRDAVAGGVFIPNAPSGPEIRFPIYNSPETAAVNFIHTVVLATRGSRALPGDGWNEGLARAITLAVCRTPGALPSTLDPSAVEAVLDATYDVGATYEFNNQRALGGPEFIASNLKTQPLPAGGSTGGLYLLRYQMAGTAWQKVLVEYPTFAAAFLSRFDQNPGAYTTDAALASLGQQALNVIEGPDARVEGRTFAEWVRRQFILDLDRTPGTKLLVQAFPFLSGLSGNDYGVYGIEAHYFRTDPFGNEELLRETANPVYWSPDYTRVFLAAQDDVLPIFLGYGSVTPNFTDAFGGEPYRMTVDVPVGDQRARLFLPAGSVATAANPIPQRLFGTVTGFMPSPGSTYAVRVEWGAGNAAELPITNFAFGGLRDEEDFGRSHRRVRVQVVRDVAGGRDVLLERWVNKGPGDLGLTLHVDGDVERSLPGGLPTGLSAVGFVGEPWESSLAARLGASPVDLLLARWNPTLGRYDAAPNWGHLPSGQGVFVRSAVTTPGTYATLAPRQVASTVALKPGWNLVVNPAPHDVNLSAIRVVTGVLSPSQWADAVTGNLVAADAFALAVSAPDPASAVPETGTLRPTALWSSGQAVYVRCFSATGALLVIDTPSTAARGFSLDSGTHTPGLSHEVALLAQQGSSTTEVRLGRARRGTATLDRGLDAELPPSAGGLQARLRGASRLFREVRGETRTESFVLHLEGLQRGVPVSLSTRQLAGPMTRVIVQVKGQSRRVSLADGDRFTMTPTTTSVELRLTWAGTR